MTGMIHRATPASPSPESRQPLAGFDGAGAARPISAPAPGRHRRVGTYVSAGALTGSAPHRQIEGFLCHRGHGAGRLRYGRNLGRDIPGDKRPCGSHARDIPDAERPGRAPEGTRRLGGLPCQRLVTAPGAARWGRPDRRIPHIGVSNVNQKIAFGEGAIDPPPTLPSTPTEAGGYQLITAGQAFSELSAGNGQSPSPTRIQTSSVALGTASFESDRGALQLPAWIFSFGGGVTGSHGAGAPDCEDGARRLSDL